MSQAPQNTPKRTRVLVKDILFQEKYKLTHTQVDIMAYIINSMGWAIKIDGFFPLTTKKFLQDLPQISEKTLEESLRVLKSMELIEVKMIKVPQWKNAQVRGISILPKGLEYNCVYYKPKEQDIINSLKTKIKLLESELDNLKVEKTLPQEEKQLEIKEPQKQQETVEKEEPKKEITPKIEDKPKIEDNNPPQNDYNHLSFPELIKTVTREFGLKGEPICNYVDGWLKETKFYINSYNKLAVKTQYGDLIQLKDPTDINKFWTYIDKNRDQIGVIINSLEELNYKYIGQDIIINKQIYKITHFKKVDGGVKIFIRNIENSEKGSLDRIFTFDECEDAIIRMLA